MERMEKQTAVEWLVEQILKEKGLVDLDIQAAKEMEKQQIMQACDFGRAYGYNQATGFPNPVSNPEEYYNKTFKSE